MYQEVVCVSSVLIFAYTYDVEVDVKQGKMLGTPLETVFDGRLYYAFYGVPYAQAPVGKLRFKDPKPPKKWEKPFDARTEFHGACAQAHVVQKNGLYGNEDCLRLNIFTPSRPKRGTKPKAVIVWVHGYAYIASFSHIYGPDFFIDNDVIFVTVTHRIGVFGFLKLNETDSHGNMGLKDIVMSLKWIKRNIRQFGGDKNNVVVMGSGSAATYLALLMTTKHSELFAKLILHSGAMFSSPLFQGDHILEKSALETKLKSKGYNKILAAPAKDIVEASKNIYNNIDIVNTQRPLIPFLPILEKESSKALLTSHPAEYIQKSDIKVKLILIGFTSQESISEVIPFLQNPNHLKRFAAQFKFMVPFSTGCKHKHTSQMYSEVAEHIKIGYFKEGVTEKSIDSFLRYVSDLTKYPIYHFIQQYLQLNRSRMFVYKFNYNGNLNAMKASLITGVKSKVRGAASGDEICYLMRCEPIWENYIKVNRDQTKDKSFIKQITELWANFAKVGEPTPSTYKGNVTWPPTTIKDDYILHLGKVIQLLDTKPEKRMYTFWNDIYRKYYENCNRRDEL